jgi:RND family efflux transporter MFP subunit
MLKKNLIGIVVVILIAFALVFGYQMGKSNSSQPTSIAGPGGSGNPPTSGPTGDAPSAEAPQGMKSPGMPSGPPTGDAPQGMPAGVKPGDMPSATAQGAPAQTKPTQAQSDKTQTIPATAPASSTVLATFYGTVEPFAEGKVQSEQGGTIIYMKAKEGDRVKKGDILIRFDNSDKLLDLENAKSALKSNQQKLEQSKLNYSTVQKDYERTKSLYDDGLVSRQEQDSMTNQLQTALTSLQNAEESVAQAQTQIRITENSLKDFLITASISGVVESKEYNLKEVYRSGETIHNIINIEQVYAEIKVPETDLLKIEEGMAVAVYFNALGKREFSGTVETILPSGADDNRNFTAKVLVANPDRSIRPGMFARVDVKK